MVTTTAVETQLISSLGILSNEKMALLLEKYFMKGTNVK